MRKEVRCDCCDSLNYSHELKTIRECFATDEVKVVCVNCEKILNDAVKAYQNIQDNMNKRLNARSNSNPIKNRQSYFCVRVFFESIKEFFTNIATLKK